MDQFNSMPWKTNTEIAVSDHEMAIGRFNSMPTNVAGNNSSGGFGFGVSIDSGHILSIFSLL